MGKPLRIVIAGAGVGGLACALALRRFGFDPLVCEQAPELREIGAGVTLSPNATRAVIALGLGAPLRAIGVTPPKQVIRHWRTGEALGETKRGAAPMRTYGAPYMHVHRADLHAVLAAGYAATGGRLQLAAKAAGAASAAKTATLILADGAKLKADLLIGADGVRSVVRAELFAPEPPRFTGHVAWRALVTRATLPSRAARAAPGVHIGPKRMFLRYPVRGRTLVNVAAFAQQAGWEEDSWSARADIADIAKTFDGWDGIVRDTISAMPADGLFKWALFARTPLKTWIAGRATVLGDAAHPMLPYMGQGAAMALEDGLVLARCLASAEGDVDEALRRYELARLARTALAQTESIKMVERLQGDKPEDYGASGRPVNEETLGFFSYDPMTVAV